MRGIFERTDANKMQFALQALTTKNTVIARNIANSDTPDYKASKLDFKEVMQEYFAGGDGKKMPLKTTNARHIQVDSTDFSPNDMVRFQNNPSVRNDGNDVNKDYEMSQQADTTIRYTMFADLVGKEIAGVIDKIKTR